jgi:hypothetical protein
MDVLRVCSTAKALAALLRQLHEIRMTSVGYAARTALRLKAGLGRILEIPTLRLLELSRIPGWSLGHSRLLAAALRRGTPALTTLGLAQSNMGSVNADILAPAIGENTSLKKLDLSNCGLKRRGTEAIAEALGTNASLTALDVSGNGLRLPSRAASSTHSITLIAACTSHPALTELTLDHNALDTGDVPAIGRLLDTGRIRMLSMRGNRLFGQTDPKTDPVGSSSVVEGGLQAFVDALAGDGTPLDAVVDIRNILVPVIPTEDTAFPGLRSFLMSEKLDRWQELVSDAAARRGIRLVRQASEAVGLGLKP